MNTNQNPVQDNKDKRTVTIMVNGRPKEWSEKVITFEQVVILQYGNYDPNPAIAYTVTYKRGQGNKPEGSMVKGESIIVKDQMIFNVTATNQS